VAIAVVVGVIAGVGFAVVQDGQGSSSKATSGAVAEPTSDPRKDLPVEVLKALPASELAEIYPEKAEAILNPESASQIKSSGAKSDSPEYIRAVLQKMGITPPEGATTIELQELLAEAETNTTSSAK